MDTFLRFKTEEILTCLLLVVVGYFIAKMFSDCGCANRVDCFNVGGAYGGSHCGGTYNPSDSTTYCQFGNDNSLIYKCNTEDVCNSFENGVCTDSSSPYFNLEQNKCPSMNQPPLVRIRSRDNRNNLQHFCGDNPKYLSNNRDLIIRGGNTIVGPPNYINNVWEGSDRCWSTPAPVVENVVTEILPETVDSGTQSIPGSLHIHTTPEFITALSGDVTNDCMITQDEHEQDDNQDLLDFINALKNTIATNHGVNPTDITITDLPISGGDCINNDGNQGTCQEGICTLNPLSESQPIFNTKNFQYSISKSTESRYFYDLDHNQPFMGDLCMDHFRTMCSDDQTLKRYDICDGPCTPEQCCINNEDLGNTCNSLTFNDCKNSDDDTNTYAINRTKSCNGNCTKEICCVEQRKTLKSTCNQYFNNHEYIASMTAEDDWICDEDKRKYGHICNTNVCREYECCRQ